MRGRRSRELDECEQRRMGKREMINIFPPQVVGLSEEATRLFVFLAGLEGALITTWLKPTFESASSNF